MWTWNLNKVLCLLFGFLFTDFRKLDYAGMTLLYIIYFLFHDGTYPNIIQDNIIETSSLWEKNQDISLLLIIISFQFEDHHIGDIPKK